MRINYDTPEAYELLHKGTLALSRAEQAGIRIDLEYVERKKKQLTRKIGIIENRFRESTFFKHWEHTVKGKVNINSNAQLSNFLYKTKKIEPVKFTITGKGATDEEALLQLNIPELNDILEARKLKKVRDTYLDAFAREQVDGYIHPFFNLHLVKTYRSSSDSPNFQNLPKKDFESMQIVRQALFARPGHQLVEADFSGIEVRVAAAYHKDKTMLKYIKDPTSDMHGDLAKQIFIVDAFDKKLPEHYVLRQAAKNSFIFPEFYGDYYKNCAYGLACNWGKLPQTTWTKSLGVKMPEGNLSDHLIRKGIKSYDTFVEHVRQIEKDFWENRFPEYAAWKERWWADYKKNGYVDFLTGFRASGIMGKNDVINYPVQGAAFHCLLWSFIQLDKIMREEQWDTRLIGQIHDSIVLDVNPDELPHVEKTLHRILSKELPESFRWINTPMEIEIDKYPIDGSWAEKLK